jgi:hypothetical protein
VLGSSVPGAVFPTSKKGVCTLDSRIAGDRTVFLQCPSKTLSSPWGKSVGGVSERAGAKAGGSNSSATFPSRVVMVKDIPVFWKAALFAGRHRNEGLGRSVIWRGYPPTTGGAPVTADVRRTPRRGTSSRMRHKAHAPDPGTNQRAWLRRRVLHSVLRPVHVDPHSHGGASLRGGAFESASRLGKPTEVGRTITGVVTGERSAARRVPPLS